MSVRKSALGFVCLTIAALAGCQVVRPSAPVVLPDGVVEPLSEEAFDEFAFRLAAGLSNAMARQGVSTPAVLRVPTIAPGKTPSTPKMRLFCRTLAEGLADRMAGQIEVAEVTGRTPDLHATVSWPEEFSSGVLLISIRDERSGRALLEERVAVTPPAAATQPLAGNETAPKQKPPARKPIDISMRASDLGPFVQARLDDYATRTIDGESGKVIFLDERHERYFAFEGQQMTRNSSGAGVEVRIRSVRDGDDVRYRVIFFDDENQPIGVTPVTPRELPNRATAMLRALTRDARASRYVFLIERD